MIVTVENMVAEYSWESIRTATFTYWDEYTITGLDALNGTYIWALGKTAEGCVEFTSPASSRTFASASASLTHLERRLSGSTGCTIGVTDTHTRNLGVTFRGVQEPNSITGMFEVQLFADYAPDLSGNHFAIQGSQRMYCNLDYDASLAEGQARVGSVPGPRSTSQKPHSSQGVWIVHRANSSGRCFDAYSFDYDVIGNIHAEIIDDV